MSIRLSHLLDQEMKLINIQDVGRYCQVPIRILRQQFNQFPVKNIKIILFKKCSLKLCVAVTTDISYQVTRRKRK